MTDEQRLWEWCGWSWWEPGEVWGYGNHQVSRELPDLTLDNLFKYAVPKLFEQDYFAELISDKQFNRATILKGLFQYTLPSPYNSISAMGKDPATALFKAILKVIDNDTDK